ncbi:hypothetical protein [Nonomuraea terrae]|nr:hypothetical protein [Nonomuraea terrae]
MTRSPKTAKSHPSKGVTGAARISSSYSMLEIIPDMTDVMQSR